MEGKYKPRDQVFIVVSNIYVRTAEVLKYAGGFYTMRFTDVPGGLRVRENMLYATKDEAEKAIKGKGITIGRDLR